MWFLLSTVAAWALADHLWQRRATLSRAQLGAGAGVTLALVVVAAIAAPSGLLLQKCVAKLLMPVGWFWLLLGGAAAGAWHAKRRGLALAAGGVWVAFTVAGSPVLGGYLVGQLESAHLQRPFDLGRFDAVIVLGGGTASTPWGEAQLGASGDRVLLGARLYHRGQTPLLVTSGSPIGGLRDEHDSVAATARIWRELGVPAEAIVEVEGARNTREESVAHARLIRDLEVRRVGLVSSAAHLPRAMALFERQRLSAELVALPADIRHAEAPMRLSLYDVLPEADGFGLLERACWEHLGAAVGR